MVEKNKNLPLLIYLSHMFISNDILFIHCDDDTCFTDVLIFQVNSNDGALAGALIKIINFCHKSAIDIDY